MKPFLLVLLFCFAAPAIAEIEPNNASAQANRITLGSAVTGQLSSRTDVDWYVFNVPSGSEFTVEVSQVIPEFLTGKWDFAIYSASGVLLSRFESWLSETETKTVQINQAGDYYIGVATPSLGTQSSRDYRIVVTTPEAKLPVESFSGVWQTNVGQYVSAHQNGAQLILALLGATEDFEGWEALRGSISISSTTATVSTIYGYVSLTLRIELTSSTTLKATQVSCSVLVAGYSCKYPNNSVFTATKIFDDAP